MKIEVKTVFEKMVDYSRFATILLATGVFFYLGVIIPDVADSTLSQTVGLAGTGIFLLGSVFFFYRAKQLRSQLEDSEEGIEYLTRYKR